MHRRRLPAWLLRLGLLFFLMLGACASPTATVTYPDVDVDLVEVSTSTPEPEPTETPVPEGVLSPKDLEAFDFVIERKLEAVPLAGLTLGIHWAENPPYSKGYGYASLEESTPAQATTVYAVASVTKQFTAVAILQLAEQGKISLDDPVTKFFPDAPESWQGITIHHLLTHTSGIPEYEGLGSPFQQDELVSRLKDEPLMFEPGSQFRYGGSGYLLLCLIIEGQSGLACEEYLQQQIFTPLGLDSTFRCQDQLARMAQGYQIVGQELDPIFAPPSGLFGSSGLCSTAEDLLKWQRALVSGEIISPESYQTMTTPTTLTDGSTIAYGYALGFDDEAVGHGGQGIGFRSWLVYYPEDDLALVLLSNTGIPAGYSLDTLASVIATRILSGPEP